jgi:hypothetical protein
VFAEIEVRLRFSRRGRGVFRSRRRGLQAGGVCRFRAPQTWSAWCRGDLFLRQCWTRRCRSLRPGLSMRLSSRAMSSLVAILLLISVMSSATAAKPRSIFPSKSAKPRLTVERTAVERRLGLLGRLLLCGHMPGVSISVVGGRARDISQHKNRGRSARILGSQALGDHADWMRRASRISTGERSAGRGVKRWMGAWLRRRSRKRLAADRYCGARPKGAGLLAQQAVQSASLLFYAITSTAYKKGRSMLAILPIRIEGDGFIFDWSWTDWLGLVALLIAIAFVITVLVALCRRTDPLKLLQHMKDILLSAFKHK